VYLNITLLSNIEAVLGIHRLSPRASHKHMLVDTTGITVGKGRILGF
jgi:hypothetical protein